MGDRFHANVDSREEGGKRLGFQGKRVNVESNKPALMRIVDPNNFVKIYESWIMCDDDIARPFIFGTESAEGTDFNILMEIVGDPERWFKGGIFESIKDQTTQKQKFIWEDRAPEAFMIAKGDGKNGFKPKKRFVFNAIPRFGEMNENNDYIEYSKENKATQALIIPQTAFNALSTVKDNHGDLDTYDVVLRKTGTTFTDTKYAFERADKNAFPKTVIGGLSAEEQAYATVDLAKEFAPTSNEDIYEFLKGKIAAIDASAGTDYLARLQKSVGASATVSTRTAAPAPSVGRTAPAPQPAAAAAPSATPARSAAPARAAAPAAPVVAGHVCHLCKTPVKDDDMNCPQCGNQVGVPCIDCGAIFSIYDTICPHCGKDNAQA